MYRREDFMKSKLFTKKIIIPIFIVIVVLLGACFTARILIVEPRLILDAHNREYDVKTSDDGLYLIGFEDDNNGNKVAKLLSFIGGYYYNLEVSEVSPSYFDCSLKKLSEKSYLECVGLKRVTLPQTVETIAAKAFVDCPDLKKVYIPASVKNISNKAFVRTNNFTMYVEKDSYAEKYAKNRKILYKYYEYEKTSTPKHNSPETVNSKKYKQFQYTSYYYNDNLECTIVGCNPMIKDGNVKIPEKINGIEVKGIAGEGFLYCENVETVTIPDSVTSVGSHAFNMCPNLEKVYFTDNVKTIGINIFDKSSDAIICAPKNSYAHKYAVENNIKFECVN